MSSKHKEIKLNTVLRLEFPQRFAVFEQPEPGSNFCQCRTNARGAWQLRSLNTSERPNGVSTFEELQSNSLEEIEISTPKGNTFGTVTALSSNLLSNWYRWLCEGIGRCSLLSSSHHGPVVKSKAFNHRTSSRFSSGLVRFSKSQRIPSPDLHVWHNLNLWQLRTPLSRWAQLIATQCHTSRRQVIAVCWSSRFVLACYQWAERDLNQRNLSYANRIDPSSFGRVETSLIPACHENRLFIP